MLAPEGDGYNGDGLMRDLFQLWLDEQSRANDQPKPGRAKAFRPGGLEDREQVRLLSRLYRRFEADLGRNLGQTENERLRSWLNDDQTPPDLIEEALKRAKLHNKANFAYIDSILNDWRAKGLTTLELVQQLDVKAEAGPTKKSRAGTRRAEKGEFDFVFEDKVKA